MLKWAADYAFGSNPPYELLGREFPMAQLSFKKVCRTALQGV